jgi:hypothetical protein
VHDTVESALHFWATGALSAQPASTVATTNTRTRMPRAANGGAIAPPGSVLLIAP